MYKFFREKGIRFQLLTYFVSLILLAVVILAGVGNMLYRNAIENETNLYTRQMINQIKTNIDFHIKEMENITYYLSQDPQVIRLLRMKDNSEEDEEYIKTQVRNVLRMFENAHPEIAGVLIVNQNDIDVSNHIHRVSRDPLTLEKWYQQSANDPKHIQLISKPIGRNITGKLNYSADNVVSIAKAVKDPYVDKVIGVILIDMRLDIIKKVIEDAKLGQTGFVYIMDYDGGIVYTPVNPIVYRIKDGWFKNCLLNPFVKKIKGNEYQILYNHSEYTKWKTIGVFSLSENQKVVSYIRFYTIIIAIGISILGMIIALFFTSSIAGPIRKLRKLMKKAEQGDLDVRFESKYNDEIGQLGNSFNHMIEKIKNLINLVYIEQQRKREAELKILEAQIKPHFLYNTLDTIQWMAQEHDAEDIIEIVGALTNLFRIGLNKGKELVRIKEELKHIESYLIIQMARYEDRLKYEINFDENIQDYRVIKILLQPLVENAIYHGIKARRGGGMIKIDVKEIDNKICFTVQDDGVGMKQEKVLEINEILQRKKEKGSHFGYGIFNVNERIKLSYGIEYGLKVSSVYGEGTVVEVWHPIIDQ